MRVQAETWMASAPDECAPTVSQRSSSKDPPYFKCVDSCRNHSHTQMIGGASTFRTPRTVENRTPCYVCGPGGRPSGDPCSRRLVPTAAARLLARCQTHSFGQTLSVPEGACCRPQTCPRA